MCLYRLCPLFMEIIFWPWWNVGENEVNSLTHYALHHIYIPAVMQYLPINILTEFLVTVKKKSGETSTVCQCHLWKWSRSQVLYPNIHWTCSGNHLCFPSHSTSSDRVAVSVSNNCFWCLLPYKLKDMEKDSFSAEKSLLPWQGSWHDGVFHINWGL